MEMKDTLDFYDMDGSEIVVGDFIEVTNFNGEVYRAVYKVVRDTGDGEACLELVIGNPEAMSRKGLRDFGYIKNGRLRKGRVLKNFKL